MPNIPDVITAAIAELMADPKWAVSGAAALISLISLYISLRAFRLNSRGQRLSLFLDFRARFINDQISEDITEVAQLMLNEELRLDPNTHSQAASRVLNHLLNGSDTSIRDDLLAKSMFGLHSVVL